MVKTDYAIFRCSKKIDEFQSSYKSLNKPK